MGTDWLIMLPHIPYFLNEEERSLPIPIPSEKVQMCSRKRQISRLSDISFFPTKTFYKRF